MRKERFFLVGVGILVYLCKKKKKLKTRGVSPFEVNLANYLFSSHRLFHSGSPSNVPAGHGINLDQVVEHYRRQHLDEEARKAKLLAAAKN